MCNSCERLVAVQVLVSNPILIGVLACRLVEGISLNKLLADFRIQSDTAHATVCQHEQQVMEIAAQLMQVCKLQCMICQVYISAPDPNMRSHYRHRINLAHLDITSSNIMLRQKGYRAWDQVRLLDFGFAQYCNTGEIFCMRSRLAVCCHSQHSKARPSPCARIFCITELKCHMQVCTMQRLPLVSAKQHICQIKFASFCLHITPIYHVGLQI